MGKKLEISFASLGFSILFGLIIGIIAYTLTASINAFLVGLSMTVILAVLTYLGLVPFVGAYLFWLLGSQFMDWYLASTELSEAFGFLKWIPFTLYFIIAIVVNIIISILAIIFILLLVSELSK